MKIYVAMLAGLMGISAASCSAGGGEGEPHERVSVVNDALEDSNALNLNALNLNALNLNALNLNALNLNSLNAGALVSLRRANADGELARELLRYMVSCALSDTQFVEIDWIDDGGIPQLDVYWGLLALEPSWATAPLSAGGARWVSACLISRVNWYGFPVLLSSRGSHGRLNTPSVAEVNDFSMMEGAFWGDLFSATPQAFACHDLANINHSRQKKRDCAAGHDVGGSVDECGIIDIVGPCTPRCTLSASGGTFFESCAPEPSGPNVGEVITVWLEL